MAGIGVRSQLLDQKYKQSFNSIYADGDKSESSSNSIEVNFNPDLLKGEPAVCEVVVGNRVMVAVDSSLEAKGALLWALSHTVQSHDTIVLLHVVNPSKHGANSARRKTYDLLCSMKYECQIRRPGVQVETATVEGKEKGPTIVEEAKQQKASVLIMGRRKPSLIWKLSTMWRDKRNCKSKVADYCIQNANCLAIAVRRKSKKCGGYLITTKRHKNFWLLA